MDRQEHLAEVAVPARAAPQSEVAPESGTDARTVSLLVRRTSAGSPPPPPPSSWHRGPATLTLLHLQRTAGNAAVVRFLQRQLATTDAVELQFEDMESIQQQLEAQAADGDTPQPADGTGDGGADGAPNGDGDGAPKQAAEAAKQATDEVDALSCIVIDRGIAMSGVIADGDGTPVPSRPLGDLGPELADGIAYAGVVGTEFNEGAFRSLRALGFTDIGAGRVYPPSANIEIEGFPPAGSEFKKQYRLKPTSTRDHAFKAVAAPAGTYDTGLTVPVTVGGQSLQLKKMIEVTEDVAAKVRRFEQEHIDDTVAAFQMSFQEAADAVNHFAGGPDGADPIYFRGNSEEEVAAYVEGRLADYHGRKKLGGKTEDWVTAYKSLLGLTISERDAKGTHSWSLARNPTVDRAAGTVTYQLNPPSAVAGASFNEISWDKV